MFENIITNKYIYMQKLRNARIQLEKDRLNNEKVDYYKKCLNELECLCDRAEQYTDSLKLVEAAVIKEIHDYQIRKIDYLNDLITKAISRIFPQRKVRAELKSDFSRTDKVSLLLYDDMDNMFIPYVCEGKLMQYLISVSAVAAITKSLSCSNIFIDEAFGVARMDHLEDLGDLLQSFVDEGLQVVVISQNPALYNSLKRHEIHLKTVDGIYETYAEVSEIKDI